MLQSIAPVSAFHNSCLQTERIDKPESKSQSKVPAPNPKKGKAILDSGLSLKSHRPPPNQVPGLVPVDYQSGLHFC